MSDILLSEMVGDFGEVTSIAPRVFRGSFTAEEMSMCYIVIKISAASAGINAGNPASALWETSFTHGETWRAIDGVVAEPITGVGEFIVRLSEATTVVGGACRLTITAPAGESVLVSVVWKSRVTDLVVFRGSSGGGGGGGATGTIVPVGGAVAYTSGANLSGQTVAAYMVGFNGVTHKEVLLTTAGAIATEQIPANIVETKRIDYSLTPVTTLVWTQVIASTSGVIQWMDIFDSSGETLEIGLGGVGAEVHLGFVIPGGNRIYEVIPAGTRISIRAVSFDAAVGEFTTNMFG